MNKLEKNVINDYSILGAKECSIKYGVSYNKILWIREKFNLVVDKETMSNIRKINTINSWKNRITIHSVDENIFIKNFTKESSYLLGFIWGDGYISNGGTNKQIRIECVSEDITSLKPIFSKTGNWCFTYRKRPNKREATTASTSNKELVEFLIQNDYKNKSMVTPEKIWDLIPHDYKKYFILGWIDADGCFYWNKKYGLRQFYVSGSYEQDWSVFEKLLKSLNIEYKIIRVIRKISKTKYSHIRITGRVNINKLGDYIFDDMIPFQRKYEKYKLIIN